MSNQRARMSAGIAGGRMGLAFLRNSSNRVAGFAGALVLLWIALNIATGGLFLSPRNLFNLTVQSSVVGIMACGMVLVIVSRNIDLSVGSLLGFIGMVIAFLQVEVFPTGAAWGWPLSIAAGLALGILVGVWQGWWIAYQRIPAFVVTLAGLLIFRGAAFLVTQGRTIAPLNPVYERLGGGIDGSIGWFWSWVFAVLVTLGYAALVLHARHRYRNYAFAGRPLAWDVVKIVAVAAVSMAFVAVMNAYHRPGTEIPQGVPVPVLILMAVMVFMVFLSRRTRFGRYVYAIGGNPEAVTLAGVNSKLVILGVFAAMGGLSALAAVVTTARLNAGASSMGSLSELYVIAAAVIGGTSLAGGVGTVAGAVLGAVFMQSLDSGMVLLDLSSPVRQIVIGLVLVLAVWSDVKSRNP